jgi:hypothetical protein
MRALVVGGTAATGGPIVQELLRRGFHTTIYHRGLHEVPLPAEVEHLHGDPHFAESIRNDLADRAWDVAVVTYGRIRLIADHLAGRTDRLITIGGWPVLKGWFHIQDENWGEHDGPVQILAPEEHPREDPGVDRFVDRMSELEELILRRHAEGAYVATHFRYPSVYGPHGIAGFEWRIIKRILDRRKVFVTGDGGQQIATRCAAPNAAHAIGLAIDHPDTAGGQIYNVGDDRQFTFQQWIELVAAAADHHFEFVDIPYALASPGYLLARSAVNGGGRYHRLLSTAKIQRELGYVDAVRPEDWVAQSVSWALANPPEADLRDEYEFEDALISCWRKLLQMGPPPTARVEMEAFRHPYPHPTRSQGVA